MDELKRWIVDGRVMPTTHVWRSDLGRWGPASDYSELEPELGQIAEAVPVSDEAVEAMISDSLEHAFDDMSERVWTEAKLKAEEMLSAVDAAFGQMVDAIDPMEKEKILQAASQVRETLTTHDARKLQAANSALDEATQELAAALVEKAMRAAK